MESNTCEPSWIARYGESDRGIEAGARARDSEEGNSVDSLEAHLDDIQGGKLGGFRAIRVTQCAALFRACEKPGHPSAIDWQTWTHSIHLRLPGQTGTYLIALLRTAPQPPKETSIFGRAAIPSDELVPLLLEAVVCRSDEDFEALIFKAFEVASRRSMITNRCGSPLRMLRLKRFIEHQCHNALTLNQMARIVGLSPFVCLRKFKEAIGVTPHAYLLECRIQKARTLLAKDCESIAAVARATGYSDQAYFARVFKKSTGLTPMQYRYIRNEVAKY